MRAALTRRALELLARLAKEEPDKYAQFWREFGRVLKEGLNEDPQSRAAAAAAALCQHRSASNDETVSLADYVGRMRPARSASITSWRIRTIPRAPARI